MTSDPIESGDGRSRRTARLVFVVLAAVAVTLALTYPLVFHLRDHVPSDACDPLCYVWSLWWNYPHIFHLDFTGYWDAPIFHPLRGAFALDEHILALAVLSAPVYALVPDLILNYNLLFLFSFFGALTGTIALARHAGRSWAASWLAGLVFAFCSHRYAQLAHLDVLYGGLAPWALLFLLRLTRSSGDSVGARHALPLRPELGNAAESVGAAPRGRPASGPPAGQARGPAPTNRGPRAWDALGLGASTWLVAFACLYHAVFLALILLAAGIFLFFSERLWRAPRAIVYAAAAALAVGATMLPIYRGYRQAQELYPRPRELSEVRFYSADLASYAAAAPSNRLLGRATARRRRPEGMLYPGVVALALAGLYPVVGFVSAFRRTPRGRAKLWRGAIGVFFLLLALAAAAALVYVATGHEARARLGTWLLRVDKLWPSFWVAAVALAAAVGVHPRARQALRDVLAARRGRLALLFLLVAALGFVLSLGPKIFLNQRGSDSGPYRWLYDHVGVFHQMRVPSRIAAYFMLGLGLLAAGGLDAVRSRIGSRRAGRALVALVFAAWTAENLSVPIALAPVPEVPAVYDWFARRPDVGAILELPVHQSDFMDSAYMYYQTRHGKPIVNGYASFPPEESDALFELLRHSREISPILEALLGRFDVTWFVVHTGDYGWAENGQSPAMFLDSPLFTKVAEDGGIVVMKWRGK